MKHHYVISFVILAMLLLLATPGWAQEDKQRIDYLTICITNSADKVDVEGISLHFFDDELDLLVYQTEGKKTHTLSASEKGISVDGKVYDTSRMRIKSTQNWLKNDGRVFREDMLVVRLPSNPNRLALVNEIQIENYLYGLINKECIASWPLAAKKAQAVAARTFAMHRKTTRARKVCDLKSSALDQVYGGYNAEDNSARLAVDNTRGEVLVYKNKFAKAYYHSTSGGVTASSESVWNDPQPYLVSRPSPYSSKSPSHEWTFKIDKNTLAKRLGVPAKYRKHFLFSVMERDETKRIKQMKISYGDKSIVLTGDKFRSKVGYTKLKSTLFTFQVKRGKVIFRGKGNGHGVGMDQWGAAGMADYGSDYKSILNHYYSGVQIRKIY